MTIEEIDDLFGHVPTKRTFASPTGEEFATVSGYASGQLRDQAIAAQQAAADAAADYEDFLATPEAAAARDVSLSAFDSLGSSQALSLTETQFGDQIEAVSSTPVDTLSEDEIIKFRGDDAALIDPAGSSDKELVVSTLPLRAPDSDGDLKAVDTTLERVGSAWVPENPVVDSSLPHASSGSIEAAGLVLDVTSAGGSETSSLALGDAARFYPQIGHDTDMTLSSLTNGVEVFFTLRSPDSPETQSMNFDLPSGASLSSEANGSISVVKDGHTVATISPPIAIDAQGSSVPTEATINGGESIVIRTEHVGRDFAYPILVDPLVQKVTPMPVEPRPISSIFNEEIGFLWPDGGWYQFDIGFPLENYGTTGTYGDGLYLSDPATGHSSIGGMWMWMPPPGASDLTQVDFGPYSLDLNGDGHNVGGAAVMGMYNSSGLATHTALNQTTAGYASLDGDDVSGDPQALDAAVFMLARIRFGTPTSEEDHEAFLGGAVAHYTDPEGAVLYGDFGQLETPTILNGWTKEDGEVTFPLRAADYGLGVKGMAILMEDEEENMTVLGSYEDPCEGTPESPCPERLDHDVTVDFSQFEEGEEYTLKFRAFDPLGETNGGLDAEIGVDRTAPTLQDLDGELVELEGTLTTRDDELSLSSGAADDQGIANSGLTSVVAQENLSDSWSSPIDCSSSDCSDVNFGVPLSQLSSGKQSITVEAKDLAGNSAKREVSFNLDNSAPDVTVNPPTANGWDTADDLRFSVTSIDAPEEGPGVDATNVEVDGQEATAESCSEACETLNYVVPNIAAGSHEIVAEATDHNGLHAETTQEVSFDRSPPELTLSGDLEDGGTIGAGEVVMSVAATEPEVASVQSGVATVRVTSDGEPLDGADQTCGEGPCDLEPTFTWDDSELPPGNHQIEVTATDLAGNSTSEAIEVTRSPEDESPPGEEIPCDEPVEVVDDTIIGTACRDVIEPQDGIVTIEGRGGNDEIEAGDDVIEIDGGSGDDAIVGTNQVEFILAGTGDDTIYSRGSAETMAMGAPLKETCPPSQVGNLTLNCRAGDGNQTIYAGAGNDMVFGERGNDQIWGQEGHDRLYGSVGDDLLVGGPDNDLLAGGNGSDNVVGGPGDDIVRGDTIGDERKYGSFTRGLSGGAGNDTLSFASGVTPGFLNRFVPFDPSTKYPGFPSDPGQRGVFVDLETGSGVALIAENGGNKDGGGHDTIASDFQNIVGTPFADYLEGTDNSNTIEGGGGPDVILGQKGYDYLYGGGESDHLVGGTDTGNTVDGGTGSSNLADRRRTDRVAVGVVGEGRASESDFRFADVYVTGSDRSDISDNLKVSYNHSNDKLTVTSTGVKFDDTHIDATHSAEGCLIQNDPDPDPDPDPPLQHKAICDLTSWQPANHPRFEPLDVLHMSGGKGVDTLSAFGANLPQQTSVSLQGGFDRDILKGSNETEDVIIDGSDGGNDESWGFSRSDSIYQGLGKDEIHGGDDGDVLYSSEICEHNTLDGGDGHDNITWAAVELPQKSKTEGVYASITDGEAGKNKGGNAPWCSGFKDDLVLVEHLEGTGGQDVLEGGPGKNTLLGRAGSDELYGYGDNDILHTHSDDYDFVINCGDGSDTLYRDSPRTDLRDKLSDTCEKHPDTSIPEYDRSHDKYALSDEPPPFGLYRFGERQGSKAYEAYRHWNDPDYVGKYVGKVYREDSSGEGILGSVPLTEDRAVKLSSTAGIDLGDPPTFDPDMYDDSSGYSVEIWVKFWAGHPTKESKDYQYIFSKIQNNGAKGIFLGRNSDSKIVFGSKYNSASKIDTVVSSNKVNDMKWHQIVGTLRQRTLSVYVDTVKSTFDLPVPAKNPRLSVFPQGQTAANVRVGPVPLSNSAFSGLPATVDSLAMYGSVLTPCQIKRHFGLRTSDESLPPSKPPC